MPIFVKFIEAQLLIQGPTQQFLFSPTEPLGSFQLFSQFIPTANIDSNVQFDFLNSSYNGYRMGLDTSSLSSTGMWHFSRLTWNNNSQQSNYTITPLITFNQDGNSSFDFQGNIIGGVKDPVNLQDAVTLGYFNTHGGGGGGSGTVTSVGATSSSKSITISNSPITVSGNIELNVNPNLVLQSLSVSNNIKLVSDSYVTSIGPSVDAIEDIIFNLPGDLGESGFMLITDGEGNTKWGASNPGTVTFVGVTSGDGSINVTDSPITTAGNINLQINPNLALNSLTTGNLQITNGSIKLVYNSYATFIGPAIDANQNTIFNLPSDLGTNSQYLMTDGKGNTSWDTPTGGITSIGISSTSNTISISGSPITSAGIIEVDVNPNLKLSSLTVSDAGGGRVYLVNDTTDKTLILAMNSTQVVDNFTFTFPSNNGTAGQFLSTGGSSGITTWQTVVTSVDLSTTTNGLNITGGPITSIGTIKISLNTELQGLSALTTNGLIVRTASGVYNSRSLVTDISGNIQILNGNGVTDNPSIGLNPNLFLNSIAFKVGSFYLLVSPPSTILSNVSFGFPSNNGILGQYLSTDGKGNTSWNTQNIIAGSANIVVTNGNTIDLNKTLTNMSSITTDLLNISNKTNAYNLSIPAAVNTDIRLVLPVDFGFNAQVLSTDGLGNTKWVDLPGNEGTVTSCGIVTKDNSGLIITGSPITTFGVITINLNVELQELSTIAVSALLCRSGVANYQEQTITAGPSGNITVNNGNGSINPVVQLVSTITSIINVETQKIIIVASGGGGNITLTTNPSATITYGIIFPLNTGTSTQYLMTDGKAKTSWNTIVTSVNVLKAGNGLIITGSPITTAGVITINLNAELEALSKLSTLGLLFRTATATYIPRTLAVGPSGQLLGFDLNGVEGNPGFLPNGSLKFNSMTAASFSFNGTSAKMALRVGVGVPTGGIKFIWPAKYGTTGQILSCADSAGTLSWINRLGDPAPSASSNVITVLEEDRDTITKEALDIFNRLDFKKYEFIDKKKNGDKVVYGPIADELKEIAPKWVKSFMEFIPNIMKNTKIIDCKEVSKKFIYKFSLSNNSIMEGDKVKIIDDNGDNIGVIKKISIDYIFVEMNSKLEGNIFLYGTYSKCSLFNKRNILNLSNIVLQNLVKEIEKISLQLN